MLGPVHHLQSVVNEVGINVRVNVTSPGTSSDALEIIIFPSIIVIDTVKLYVVTNKMRVISQKKLYDFD